MNPCPIWQEGCGCPLMPYDADAQAAHKHARVVAAFAGMDVRLSAVVRAAQTLHYRSKVTFVAKSLGSRTILGAYRRGSHFVLDLQGCVIEEPALARAAAWLRHAVAPIPAYDEAHKRGSLRYVVMRASVAGEVLVTLVSATAEPHTYTRVAEAAVKAGIAAGVFFAHNGDPGNAIWKSDPLPLAGLAHLHEDIDGLRMRLSPQSFFQVHRAQASLLRDALVQHAQNAVGSLRGARVWDLFSGAGVNALRFAREGARVSGLESVAAAVQDAIINASINELTARFSVCDLDQGLPALAQNTSPQVVILNPPRKGASPPLIDAIAALAPAQILYVACAPRPVAEAAKRWLGAGYKIQQITPYDLFPQTEHIETLAVFTRQTSL